MHGESINSLNDLLFNKQNAKLMFTERDNIDEVNTLINLGRLLHNSTALQPNAKNSIPAGYTYLGQFIDHDIVFSTNSCPAGQGNCQPPIGYESKLNLSAVYGDLNNRDEFEKLDYFDRHNRIYIDLPKKSNGRESIPDPRNNENLLISQLHLQFIKLHNILIDDGMSFSEARNKSIAIYQSIILNDFLKKILYTPVWEAFFGNNNRLYKSSIFFKPFSEQPIAPEFTKAAFRYGHSMIKKEYSINSHPNGKDIVKLEFIMRRNILTNTISPETCVDWTLFFNAQDNHRNVSFNRANPISPSLRLTVNEMGKNGLSTTDEEDLKLIAVRNLLRGKIERLPDFKVTATKIRKYIARPNIANSDLKDLLKKLDYFIENDEWLKPRLVSCKSKSTPNYQSKRPALNELTKDEIDYVTKTPPLWYGILCESHYFKGPNEFKCRSSGLGPVGSIIVAETFSHLLDESLLSMSSNAIKTMPELIEFLKGEQHER